MIPAGDLDRRAAFKRATATRNALNEVLPAGWVTVATVWTRRTPISDGERVAAQQVGREISDRFLVRWTEGLSALGSGDQVDCQGVSYKVDRVKEIGRREGLEFTALARPEAGA